ncbi:hypothetical protein [Ideonella oryzae]|uniref:Uncharacterized protein n=1 Tax=Ideonella oryzae TaxID=2937441 RepID=A0ABT1BLT4_9BURK|nr:hypothetical protein [Ideonella oryzae]MCO5976799.1 hypothetical protein [Ideonella oryzae]
MNAAALEGVTRAVGDVLSLSILATELVGEAEAGDTGRIHRLGAVLRALQAQAQAAHGQADAQWMAAHAAEVQYRIRKG